jgi:hypothetical protein
MGVGGVVWQRYVLKKPHTSNKVLHELAREVRGVEKRRGKKLTSIQYKTFMIVGKLLRTHFCDRDTIILLNCWLSWIA